MLQALRLGFSGRIRNTMVSTRQQSIIGGGADNSGSNSGSESSGSSGSSKSLRHHTSHQSTVISSSGNSNFNGSSGTNCNGNNGNNHEGSGVTAIVRSYVSTRLQSNGSSDPSSGSEANFGSKSLKNVLTSVINNSGSSDPSPNPLYRSSVCTRQLHNAISSNASVSDSSSGLSLNSDTYSVSSTKSLRHHSSSHQSSSLSNTSIVSCHSNINGQGASNIQQPYISNVRLLDLPHDVLEKIFSYIGYKNVSQMRLVS